MAINFQKIILGTPPTALDGDTNRSAWEKTNYNLDVTKDAIDSIQATIDELPDVDEKLDALTESVDGKIDAVVARQNQLENAQTSNAIYAATWADLSNVLGTFEGQGAFVTSDAGTHTDPVSGETVPNSGQYRWMGSAWQWLRADTLAALTETVAPIASSFSFDAVTGLAMVAVDSQRRMSWFSIRSDNGKPGPYTVKCINEAIDAASAMQKVGFEIVDVPGYALALADENGRLSQLAIDARTGKFKDWVYPQLATAITPYLNIPEASESTASINLSYLRKMRMRLGQIRAGDAQQLDICFIGDSYTAGHLYYLNRLTQRLAADFGFAGPGFVGLNHGAALGDTDFQFTRSSTTNFGGSWMVGSLGGASPDNRIITSGAAGDYVEVRAVVATQRSKAVTAAKVICMGTGTLRYRWQDTDDWTETSVNSSTPVAIDMSVLPTPATTGTYAWKLRLEAMSAGLTVFGFWLGSSTPGVRISKCAASGSTSGNWYHGYDAAWMSQWKTSMSLIPADAYFIMLGGNDQSDGVSPATYLANIQGIVAALREINPAADIHITVRADTSRVSSVPMSAYADAVRSWASANKIPFTDLQRVFGPDPAQYANDGVLPLIGSDNTHPISETGGRLLTDSFARIITYSTN